MQWLSDGARNHLCAVGYQQWVADSDTLTTQALQRWQATPIQPIYGGKAGIIIHVQVDGQDRILKVMPPEWAEGQIVALQAFNGHRFPQLYEFDQEQGMLLMEYLPARACPRETSLDMVDGAQLLQTFAQFPANKYVQTHHERTEEWFAMVNGKVPTTLQHWLSKTRQLVQSAPASTHGHLHGDIGVHNLMIDNDQRLWAVDPGAVLGPLAFDAGGLAVWGGPRLQAPARVTALATHIGESPREIARWAIFRSAVSSGFGYLRGDERQYHDCLQVLEPLHALYDAG